MGSPKYQRDGRTSRSGPGFAVTAHPDTLNLPFRWRAPRRIFVNSMSDLSVWVVILSPWFVQVRRHSCTSLCMRQVSGTWVWELLRLAEEVEDLSWVGIELVDVDVVPVLATRGCLVLFGQHCHVRCGVHANDLGALGEVDEGVDGVAPKCVGKRAETVRAGR
jgi:hypothetical protein